MGCTSSKPDATKSQETPAAAPAAACCKDKQKCGSGECAEGCNKSECCNKEGTCNKTEGCCNNNTEGCCNNNTEGCCNNNTEGCCGAESTTANHDHEHKHHHHHEHHEHSHDHSHENQAETAAPATTAAAEEESDDETKFAKSDIVVEQYDETANATATIPIPAVKMGMISKQGQGYKSWKKRHCVLIKGHFAYYEKAAQAFPYGAGLKGEIPSLKGMSIKENGKVIELVGGEYRDINLQFDNDTDKAAWLVAINQHIEYSNAIAK